MRGPTAFVVRGKVIVVSLRSAVRPREKARSGLDFRSIVAVTLVLASLAGLPIVVWLDLRSVSAQLLEVQASQLAAVIEDIRGYFARNVTQPSTDAGSTVSTPHEGLGAAGAVPIPAQIAMSLGDIIGGEQRNLRYRFFSDYPFAARPPHRFDAFEREALATLRREPRARVVDVSGSIVDRRVRLVTPIIMAAECVACHNARPDSPKRDWKIGDVRGIQEIDIRQPLAANVSAVKHLLVYFLGTALAGLTLVVLQRRDARLIRRINRDLRHANTSLADVADKLSKYLPPQLYGAIFSGRKDVTVTTERKKLTIFFSDIADFTATAERLQPEELTTLLNEYLTEMSRIAVAHGATIDKFVGDAMLVFFGDPETQGVVEDARRCVRMATEMQHGAARLAGRWSRRGVALPFRVRMGLNTGYCNVGNFGSADRMTYTIIGAEANLAARLQAIAEPRRIVLSHETHALVRDAVRAHPLAPITMKGIAHPVVPYVVDGLVADSPEAATVINEHTAGLDLFLDTGVVGDAAELERARRALVQATRAIDLRLGDHGMAGAA